MILQLSGDDVITSSPLLLLQNTKYFMKKHPIIFLGVFIGLVAGYFLYLQGLVDSTPDAQINMDVQGVADDTLVVDDMNFPTTYMGDVFDERLNGVLDGDQYNNPYFGFSVTIPAGEQLRYEKHEQWSRGGFADYYRQYLKFSDENDHAQMIINSENIPYDNLDTWAKTDEGTYRLTSDVVVEPAFQTFADTAAVVFDASESGTYTMYLVQNNVLYEITIAGLSLQERNDFLHGIAFFKPAVTVE